jgi:hypothetical protein
MEYLLICIGLALLIVFVVVSGKISLRKKKSKLSAEFGSVIPTKYSTDTVSYYWDEFSKKNPDPNSIDSITWQDLDMDDVFKRINRCQSSVGEEYLYALLHAPTNPETLEYREKLIQCFDDELLRTKTQVVLDRLGIERNNGLYMLMFYPQLFKLEHEWRYTLQAFLPLIGIAALFFNAMLGFIILVVCLLANMATFTLVQRKTEHMLESISYLLKSVRCAKKLSELLKDSAPEFSQRLKSSAARFEKLNLSSFLLAVKPSSDAEIAISFIGMTTLLPIIQYCKAIKVLSADREMICELFEAVGLIDAAISTASYRESLPVYSRPTFTSTLMLKGTAVYHPLLSDPVVNDVDITKNLLLTGSNASGKSTYVKAIAINALLAQTLHMCCADSLTLKPAAVITSMGIQDNIIGGESYFVVEIKSMKRIVAAADTGAEFYCFIDEILKGTNTTERIAAAAAVLQHLYQKNCICIAATHDLELTVMLSPEYLNNHFTEQITDEGMLFDYKLKDGPSQSKNALKLLSHYDYPEEITASAKKYVEVLEQQTTIP